MNHEEFAERAERRLKEVADLLEVEGKDLQIAGEASKITARAQELRVAARGGDGREQGGGGAFRGPRGVGGRRLDQPFLLDRTCPPSPEDQKIPGRG